MENEAILVDFIGIAGTGKTTLLNGLKFSKTIINGSKYKNIHLSPFSLVDNSPAYQQLLAAALNEIANANSPVHQKFADLNALVLRLNTDGLLRKYHKKVVFVFDEGIIEGYWNVFDKLIERDSDFFQEFSKNRAIVFCDAPLEIIVDRFIKRESTKPPHAPWYQGETERELLNYYKEMQEAIRNFVAKAQNFLPILTIQTTNNFSDNIKIIQNFIEGLPKN